MELQESDPLQFFMSLAMSFLFILSLLLHVFSKLLQG